MRLRPAPISGSSTEPSTSPPIPTVSELTAEIRSSLEQGFASIVVQGEIAEWTEASSGHRYFSLKDDQALLNCVMWRSRAIDFPVKKGLAVVARGRVTLYPPRGAYQLDCVSLTPQGEGELQMAFEQLKRRLKAEGLFDSQRKRPLPPFPHKIGVVTSASGAALRDILTTLRRRMPSVAVVLCAARVQGTGSAEEVAEAIRRLCRHGGIDLMIVGRGGGSIEDLWAFNEEVVARAIYESSVPIISAVGHETDFTIADFVADVRAATPTAAAELAVAEGAALLELVRTASRRFSRAILRIHQGLCRRLDQLVRTRGMHRVTDLLRTAQQRLDDADRRISRAGDNKLKGAGEQISRLEASLRALNPDGVLARGYAMVQRDGTPVSTAAELRAGDLVDLRFRDGKKEAKIQEKSG